MLLHSVLSPITTPCSRTGFISGARSLAFVIIVFLFIQGLVVGQSPSAASAFDQSNLPVKPDPKSAAARYRDPQQGVSSNDLVRRALAANGDLAAARLNVDRARGRLRQASLRPNPTLDFEHTSERLTGAGTDRATSIGVAVPIELGGKRGRRIDLARWR